MFAWWWQHCLSAPRQRLWDQVHMSVIVSLCVSFCVHDCCKSNLQFYWNLMLWLMIGPTSQKNYNCRCWSGPGYSLPVRRTTTVGADPVLDTDSGSVFHFPRHCGIGDFRRFIIIFHTVTRWFLWHSAKWWRRQHNESTTFWEQCECGRYSDSIPDHFRLILDALMEVCALWPQSSCF